MTRQDWRNYVESLRLPEYYAGVQALGFVRWVTADGRPAYEAQVRGEGFPNFAITPPGEREEHAVVTYIEPFEKRNLRAFGYDLWSEPVRRAGLSRARDTGLPALTGKVFLMQETATDVQPGVIMMVPVYRSGQPADTVEQRRAALLGWVHAPFRMRDLMQGMLGNANPEIGFDLFDGGQPVTDAHLFNSDAEFGGLPASHRPSRTETRRIELAGRAWTLQFHTRPSFETSTVSNQPFLIAVGGVAIDGLLFAIIWSLAGLRRRAERLAEQMTVEYRGANEALTKRIAEREQAQAALRDGQRFLNSVTEASPHWIYIFDLDEMGLTYSNRSILAALGHPQEAQSAEARLDVFSEFMAPGEMPHLARVLEEWRTLPDGRFREDEYHLRHANGSIHSFAGREVVFARRPDGTVRQILGTLTDITLQKHGENALRASEARFRAVQENLGDGLVLTSLDDVLLEVNPRMLEMSGYAREEIIGRRGYEVFNAPEQAGEIIAHNAERGEGRSGRYEILLRRKDGSRYWAEITGAPLRDAEGRVCGTIGVLRDITERKRAADALRESEERFQAFMSQSPVVAWVKDEEFKYRYVNAAFEKLFGKPASQFLGRIDHELSAKEFADEFQSNDRKVLASGASLDTIERVPGTDGKLRRWLVQKFPLHRTGQPTWVGGTAMDVTDRMEVEEALRASETAVARLASFPEMNPNPVVELSAGGDVLYCNAAATGLTEELGFAEPVQMLPPDAAGIARECLAVNQSRTRLEMQCGKRIISWSFHPIPALGTVHCYAGDVTERRQLEEQFRQSQKMEGIGQLAGGVAHDFNNILAAILMQTELAAGSSPEETREMLGEIKASADRAANLTRQLLAFSRRQVMQTRLLNLNENVTQLTRMLERILGEDVRLQIDLACVPLMVHADAGMLDQVLLNLMVNARDAMPGGGALTIATGEKNLTEAEARLIPDAKPGPHAHLTVRDTGPGIPPEILPRIFEPFFTTKETGKGTGLGLATVFGIVKQHGGAIQVESEPGCGTTFHVYLPAVAESAAAAAPAAAAGPKPHGGTETILVVEDDPSLRRLTQVVLERQGYRVLVAADGVEARRLWKQHAGEIQLLLTDMVMPEGISGRDLAAQLTGRDPTLRVVFTSGYSSDTAGRELKLQPGQSFLPKPSTPAELLETVRRTLDGARPPQQNSR